MPDMHATVRIAPIGDCPLENFTPSQANAHDAGYDLRAAIPDHVVIQPNSIPVIIPTGIALDMRPGIVAMVCPRSGLAAKNAVTVANAPGIIDSGYRGEVKVILINHHPNEALIVRRGDRVAQLVFLAALKIDFVVCKPEHLSSSDRGAGGLGSSGVQ